ncbi:MAG: signal peptidase II [Eubacteriales bacterium]
MLYILLFLTTVGVIALDQWTKFLTIANIPMYGQIPVWDGVFHLTYILNTGAAFSMLEGQMWFFFLITLAFLVGVGLVIWKKWITHPVGLFAIAMITGGAIGNFIDRMTIGAVVDMIEVEFMDFAIFNVADSFIVVGAILLCIWAIFLDRKPKEKQA